MYIKASGTNRILSAAASAESPFLRIVLSWKSVLKGMN